MNKVTRTEVENEVALKLCNDQCMECKSCKVYKGTCTMYRNSVEQLVEFYRQGGRFVND